MFVGFSCINSPGDKNYNAHRNEYAPLEQSGSDGIEGMKRSEDRARNEDN